MCHHQMHMQEAPQNCQPLIDVNIVRQLIDLQFPQWAGLSLAPVLPGGWDNRTFRLGADKLVRLPSAAAYVEQVEKEQTWLPKIAANISLAIPEPIAKGKPSDIYPWPWSVYRWLAGEPAAEARVDDKATFARDLASFLHELHQVPVAGAPQPGLHNFFRGDSLAVYDAETRSVIVALADFLDADTALAVWDAALKSKWTPPPVWVHGDIACGNLLVNEGRLCAVIDFGCSAVGDPACDLAIAWTFFEGKSRRAFRAALPLDGSTWARGRGWAMWKALITLEKISPGERKSSPSYRTLQQVLLDHYQANEN